MSHPADATAPDSEPNAKGEGARPEPPRREKWVWLAAAAAPAIFYFPPTVAAALLMASSLELKRGSDSRFPVGLRTKTPPPFVDVWLDLAFAAALSASLGFGALTQGATGVVPRALRWLPLGLAALNLLAQHHPLRPAHTKHGTTLARSLLAVSLGLTPLVGALVRLSAAHWAIVASVVWSAVHLLGSGRLLMMRIDSSGVVRQTGLILAGKGSALRNATAAAVATALDFSLYSALVGLAAFAPPLATLCASASGGLLNFLMNRNWTFSASGSNRTMARRYVTVSVASALLNAGLVAVLMWLPGGQPTLAWLVARGLVFLGWNYPMQRDYVFAHRGAPRS